MSQWDGASSRCSGNTRKASNSCPGVQGLSSSVSNVESKLHPERQQELVNGFKWEWQISHEKSLREMEKVNVTGAVWRKRWGPTTEELVGILGAKGSHQGWYPPHLLCSS